MTKPELLDLLNQYFEENNFDESERRLHWAVIYSFLNWSFENGQKD